MVGESNPRNSVCTSALPPRRLYPSARTRVRIAQATESAWQLAANALPFAPLSEKEWRVRSMPRAARCPTPSPPAAAAEESPCPRPALALALALRLDLALASAPSPCPCLCVFLRALIAAIIARLLLLSTPLLPPPQSPPPGLLTTPTPPLPPLALGPGPSSSSRGRFLAPNATEAGRGTNEASYIRVTPGGGSVLTPESVRDSAYCWCASGRLPGGTGFCRTAQRGFGRARRMKGSGKRHQDGIALIKF